MPGYLEWSIKLSLLMYVTSAPGGRLETDGVTSDRGRFRFPLLGDAGPDDSAWEFGGSVRLFGHYGSFITELSGLRLEQQGAEATLSFRPSGAEAAIPAFRATAAAGTAERREYAPVVLRAEGVAAFGDHYRADELFDPMSVVFGG